LSEDRDDGHGKRPDEMPYRSQNETRTGRCGEIGERVLDVARRLSDLPVAARPGETSTLARRTLLGRRARTVINSNK